MLAWHIEATEMKIHFQVRHKAPSHTPVLCAGFGALKCACLAEREAYSVPVNCEWERAAQRRGRSGPLEPGKKDEDKQT